MTCVNLKGFGSGNFCRPDKMYFSSCSYYYLYTHVSRDDLAVSVIYLCMLPRNR